LQHIEVLFWFKPLLYYFPPTSMQYAFLLVNWIKMYALLM